MKAWLCDRCGAVDRLTDDVPDTWQLVELFGATELLCAGCLESLLEWLRGKDLNRAYHRWTENLAATVLALYEQGGTALVADTLQVSTRTATRYVTRASGPPA